MKRTLARLAMLALATPLTVAGIGGSAQASTSVTVPGCYGAVSDDLIVCNLTFSVTNPTVELYQISVKVCAGTCYNVPVTLPRAGESGSLCYTWRNGAGVQYGGCVSGDQAVNIDAVTAVCLRAGNFCTVEE